MISVVLVATAIACSDDRPPPSPEAPAPAQPLSRVSSSCVSERPGPDYARGLTNVARRGTASQSSTGHWSWDATPDLAIDGNTNGDYFAHSVSHTLDDSDGPWWQVDLGREHRIEKIVIWNRTDHDVGKRLTDFKLVVSSADGIPVYEKTLCEIGSFSPALTVPIPDGHRGQVVRIRLNQRDFLQLAEVEVFVPGAL